MWIVRLALRRPYTFVVLAILILVVGIVVDRPHANRYFPEHRYPSREHYLELQRPCARADG